MILLVSCHEHHQYKNTEHILLKIKLKRFTSSRVVQIRLHSAHPSLCSRAGASREEGCFRARVPPSYTSSLSRFFVSSVMSEFSLDIHSQIGLHRGPPRASYGNDDNDGSGADRRGDDGDARPGDTAHPIRCTDVADMSELDDYDEAALQDDGGGDRRPDSAPPVPLYAHNFKTPVWSLAAMRHRHVIKDGEEGREDVTPKHTHAHALASLYPRSHASVAPLPPPRKLRQAYFVFFCFPHTRRRKG